MELRIQNSFYRRSKLFQKYWSQILVFAIVTTLNVFATITLCMCNEEPATAFKHIKSNGYMLAKSNCNANYVSNWGTEDIGNELKNWFKSIEVVKNDNKYLPFNNKNYVKLSRNANTNEVIVTSIGRLVSQSDEGIINFEGWTKYMYTSNDQFHDGFYYGLMTGINGTVTGK